ncbi:MAG: hypothetical protein F6K08_24100 [Okeania sp. SIO1H6]|nr:hypothetical protein [Okeania sp. SIO1H6]
MGRPKREFKSGYSYHITTRCNNRDFNLTRRETREILLHIIKQAQEKYPFKLYALCIMRMACSLLDGSRKPLCHCECNEAIFCFEIASLR